MTDTYQPKKQGKNSALPLKHWLTGVTRVRSILLGLHPEFASIVLRIYRTFLVALILLNRKRKLPTAGSVLKSKRTTWEDKKIFSDVSILIASWCTTLRQESTGKGKVLKPFWNERCQENSNWSWLPTETDYADLGLNSSSGSFKSMVSNSLCSIERVPNPQMTNLPMTYSPLFMCTPVEKWVDEDIRCRKIRLYPTLEQKMMFKKWIGTCRYVYNRALAGTKNGEKMNFQSLRNKYVTARFGNDKDMKIRNPIVEDWELETPKEIRAGAVDDLVKAFSVAITNLRKHNISRFDMQYRKKKRESSIVIPSSAIKVINGKLFFYPKTCRKPIAVSKDKAFPSMTFQHDCRLKNDNGIWSIYIPHEVKPTVSIPKREVCALDPGTRKFQTIYGEDAVIKIGIRKDRVKKLQARMDLLQSLRGRKLIRKCHFTQKMSKIQFKMKNMVDDLHYQTIQFLTTTYKLVFIPKFENQELVRVNRSKQFRRDIFSLRHYTFRQRLIAKAKLHNYCFVEECTEEYTSKTCTRCGNLKYDLGSNEMYNCSKCGLRIDRDINGARNIFIKTLGEKDYVID
jgi:putative transposase